MLMVMDNSLNKNLLMVLNILLGFSHLRTGSTTIEEVEQIFNEIDKNNSGYIDYHGNFYKNRICNGCSKLIEFTK